LRRRLEQEHDVECRANAAYEAYRARERMKDGRRVGRPPNPYRPPETPIQREYRFGREERIRENRG
jgi:hypothetical protein